MESIKYISLDLRIFFLISECLLDTGWETHFLFIFLISGKYIFGYSNKNSAGSTFPESIT